jgi:hypothetical protein
MISRDISVELGGQTVDSEMDLTLKDMAAASLANQLPPIMLYDHYRQKFGPDIRLHLAARNDNDFHLYIYLNELEYSEGTDGKLTFSAGNMSVSGTSVYHGQSGAQLSVDNDGYYDVPWNCRLTARLSFDMGDSNFDGQINVLDLQNDINFIFNDNSALPFNFTAANLHVDDLINVQDVVKEVDLLMALEEPDEDPALIRIGGAGHKPARSASSEQPAAVLGIVNGQLLLTTEVPVAAFDIVVSGAGGYKLARNLQKLGMTCTVNQQGDVLHIIGYSLTGGSLPVGETAICSLSEGTVTRAMLSDVSATEISVTFNAVVTGISDASQLKDETMDHGVYDLQGRKIENRESSIGKLNRGLYIINGKKVVK